ININTDSAGVAELRAEPSASIALRGLVQGKLSSGVLARRAGIMIVIISDLHFEEEASDAIPGQNGGPGLMFRRNFDGKSYRSFFSRMAEQVERRRLREFNLIFAGDLFDFNRTAKWFESDVRPYVPLNEVTGPLEERVLSL